MPRKGMRSVFFRPSPSCTLSDSLMDENIEIARSLITKWDFENSPSHAGTTLFIGDRREARQYIDAVKRLQAAMQYLIAQDSTSQKLVQAQLLMQLAMKKLDHEFHHILAANRDHMDAESVSSRSFTSDSRTSISDFDEELLSSEDDFRFAGGDPITETERVSMLAMADLRVIADCMFSSGYGKECISIYKIMRKSIVDEALRHLGMESLSSSQIKKMDWQVLDWKIKNWMNAIRVAVRTLFYSERILCDHVFPRSEKMKEVCFAEIARDSATFLLRFPELVAKCKKTPEKIFRTLDLYEAISDHLPEIQSIFSFQSTSVVRSQAVSSLDMLGQSVRTMLSDFETAIHKECSKKPVPGGGVHPLTRYVMNYITFLNDYSRVLVDIVADWPLPFQSPLPESCLPNSNLSENESSAVTVRIAWVIIVLLSKLDGKAEYYKDDALSYLFLANNLQYIVRKVRTSSLRILLGGEWLEGHESRIKEYVSKYERMGWSRVLTSLPENPTVEVPPEKARTWVRSFNVAFHEAYRKQRSWIVSDPKLRDEIERSITSKLMPRYRELYDKYRVGLTGGRESDSIRLSPDDLENYLSGILHGKRDFVTFSSSLQSFMK
ncbi:exocyst complex component EXO70H1-like [Neltuma alba]|uniref:exocyst complex component EXO70H1-like n=1 Tax=Neltuma alba TaxID=207710 RepID=UPI0010A33ED5|nr:exocyst complex component EXO70H1-like [Prosopis alba]